MTEQTNNLVVVDFEATCVHDYDPEFRKRQEIIEFGVCVVRGTDLEILEKQSIFVTPVFNPILTSFCTNLTSIAQEQVDGGLLFEEALDEFNGLCKKFDVRTFACWGDFDWKILEKNCRLHNLKSPIENTVIINIKQLVAAWYEDKPCSVGQRLNKMNLKFQGSPHRGIDDAINITRILKTMHKDCALPLEDVFDLYIDGGQASLVQCKFNKK